MARQGSGRGFGSYPDVGLKAARSKAAEHRALIAKGIDPIQWARPLGPSTAAPCSRAPCTRSRHSTRRPCWPQYGGPSRRSRKAYPAIRRVFERARVILRDEHDIAMPDNPARWDNLKAM